MAVIESMLAHGPGIAADETRPEARLRPVIAPAARRIRPTRVARLVIHANVTCCGRGCVVGSARRLLRGTLIDVCRPVHALAVGE